MRPSSTRPILNRYIQRKLYEDDSGLKQPTQVSLAPPPRDNHHPAMVPGEDVPKTIKSLLFKEMANLIDTSPGGRSPSGKKTRIKRLVTNGDKPVPARKSRS